MTETEHLGVGVPQAADVVTTPGRSGVKVGYVRFKMVVGGEDVAVDVTDSDPLPVGGSVLDGMALSLKKIELHLASLSGLEISDKDVS